MFHNPLADGLVILVILVLFFAPKRLPQFGRSVGEGIKEFKDGITGHPSSEQAQLTPEAGDGAAPAPADKASERTT